MPPGGCSAAVTGIKGGSYENYNTQIPGKWGKSVTYMCHWWANNIDRYDSCGGTGSIKIEPIGKSVYRCCDGFVSSCLIKFGAIDKFYNCNNMTHGSEFTDKLAQHGFTRMPYDINKLQPGDVVCCYEGSGYGHAEIYEGIVNGAKKGWGWGGTPKKVLPMPHGFPNMRYKWIWRLGGESNPTTEPQTNNVQETIDCGPPPETSTTPQTNTATTDTTTPPIPSTVKIGGGGYPKGKGKRLDPNGMYTVFHTFGYGKDQWKVNKFTGVECCKKVINTIIKYNKATVGAVILKYHLGLDGPWETEKEKLRQKVSKKDYGSNRYYSGEEWVAKQEQYRESAAGYMNMPLNTPFKPVFAILYPLVTCISRIEQGYNSEEACAIALKELGIN